MTMLGCDCDLQYVRRQTYDKVKMLLITKNLMIILHQLMMKLDDKLMIG